MSTSSEPIKEQAFWGWFLENEDILLSFSHTDENRDDLFDRVHQALKRVDENLAFEFGPQDSRREFIVNAGGIKSSFPAVLRLQQTQPPLGCWAITYFQPRREPLRGIAMAGLTVNSQNMTFSILSRDADIGLEIFIPGYDETDSRYKQIGYLFLDQALGEFDVDTKVSYLRFFSESEPLKYDRLPFGELPTRFDELYDRLNGLSGKPS